MIRLESPDQPKVRELIDKFDNHQSSLYPRESNHFLDLVARSSECSCPPQPAGNALDGQLTVLGFLEAEAVQTILQD